MSLPLASPAARPAVGLDLGGTQVRAALVAPDGRLLARAATRTDVSGGPRAVVEQMRRLVDDVTAGQPRHGLAGIGVCAPGPLDSAEGMVLGIPTLPGWTDVPLTAWLQEALELPVRLENDGVGAALGEWRYGAGRGLSDFVYVTVSTGIGGGVVSDGRLLRGRRRLAAHIGHMTVVPDGPLCPCGNSGCWEAVASGSALGRRAREAAAAEPSGRLAELAHALAGGADAAVLVRAARDGDAAAGRLIDEEASALGLGIVNLLHLFSPQRVVLGGGVAQAFDLLQAGIAREIDKRAMPPFRDVPVVAASCGQDAGLVGAAALILAPPEPPTGAGSAHG
ncbi:ROK family protein [Pseudaquabacterium rugosum]|uniref:ROK family protein n=1 Tax=Pseudaquabacterium rugosum TaxID=2984194 RepID=A0ABU9BEB8_9BURK